MTEQTLADIIFGARDGITKKELKTLHDASPTRDVEKRLKAAIPGARWSGIWGQVRETFPALFQIPVADLLLKGWDAFEKVDITDDSVTGRPESRVHIPLYSRTFTTKHHPRIELYYQGAKVGELLFTFTLKLHFESLDLVFDNGRLHEIRPGRCEGKTELSLGGQVILMRTLHKVELPGSISFGSAQKGTGEQPAQSRRSVPELPPARRKRGCGCFILLFLLALLAAGGFWAMQNRGVVEEILRRFS